jgi:hypothetical protein
MVGALPAQVVINEGSNRNYLLVADEDGEYPDWIELYNAGNDTANLLNYALSDKLSNPAKWVFPSVKLAPGEFKVVFCSGKDRKPVSGFINVVNTGTYNPIVGWNTHAFTTPFYWDGVSNVLINTCSYWSWGYTTNSVHNQSATPFLSTLFSFQDGSPAACFAGYGTPVYQRPNMKLNGHTIGNGTIQNSPYDYPAPYGNWYWGARHQILILASELSEAGLAEGDITSLAFDVVSTDPNTYYDYIDIHMKLVSKNELTSQFETVDPNNNLHTNFKIDADGEDIYLYSPGQVMLSQLFVDCENLDDSRGLFPDTSPVAYYFGPGTPGATNNNATAYYGYLLQPVFSKPSGFYESTQAVYITNPNTEPCSIYYTQDGSDPTTGSTLYTGAPVFISSSAVLRARAIGNASYLPGPISSATYLIGADHTTPVVSVITDNNNLYGPTGIFDNWWTDWERAAYVEYFDSLQQMAFSQPAGIQMDGGAGGSRSQPQRSFRVEMDDGVLGAGPVEYPIIPFRPGRTQYGKIYLRNGSNQYLVYPQKDATQVEILSGETNNYYSAWRPVSVYINGAYFGLYELREKFDAEYFETLEDADPDSLDILSLSYWYGGVLRAVEGSTDPFFEDYSAFNALDPADPGYWEQADQYFDLEWYTDYIIGESWIANVDWPWNNIKIYRSDATGFRWRFCIIDVELAMAPNSWTDCYFDHIQYIFSQDPNIPYVNIWLQSIQNNRFRDYFINRYADVMNTTYGTARTQAIDDIFYNLMVPEMPNEFARWGDPWNIEAQMEAYQQNHLTFQSQLAERTNQVRDHIKNNFALPNQVDVNLNVFPSGSGSIRISTIEPDAYPWQGVYFNGVPVRLEAVAGPGYHFVQWGENGLVGDLLDPVFLDTLDVLDISFDAYFELNDFFVSTNAEPTEGGTTTGDGSYPQGSEVTVVASPNPGFRFDQWEEADSVVSVETHYTFNIYQDRDLTAIFTPLTQYNVAALPNPTEGGTTTGSGLYYEDSLAVVTAIPYDLWEFSNWTEDGSVVSMDSSYIFTVTSDRELSANFVPVLRIGDAAGDMGLSVFPNPAGKDRQVVVRSGAMSAGDEIVLLGISGTEAVRSYVKKGSETVIHLAGCPAGLYLVQWRRSGAVLANLRLVIE